VKVLLFGGSGQIGRSLLETAQKRGWEVVAPSHTDVDICVSDSVAACVRQYAPAALVNAAAYTGVDQAESEPDQAFAVNCHGARIVAEAAARARLPLVHLSTDYVFDGAKTTPYLETDPVNPLGVYARSKEAGERAVRTAIPRHIILRTAWAYSPFGSNFVRTMLRLGTERGELCVVDDQTGCPTSSLDVAEDIARILTAANAPEFDHWGTYHCVGADAVTWFGFACAIFESAKQFGVVAPKLRPIATAEFPRPATRPSYSVLSNAKLERVLHIWPRALRSSLTECLKRILS
jgi:dTDP-4-dehydrorhamnose reductase